MRICVGVDYLISLYSFRAYTKKIKNKNRNKNLSHNQMVMGRRILGGHHLKKNKKNSVLFDNEKLTKLSPV